MAERSNTTISSIMLARRAGFHFAPSGSARVAGRHYAIGLGKLSPSR